MKKIVKSLLALLILLVGLSAYYRFEIGQSIIAGLLREHQLNLELEVEEIGLRGFSFGRVSIFDGLLSARKVEVNFSLASLFKKRLHSLKVSDGVLDLSKWKNFSDWEKSRTKNNLQKNQLPFDHFEVKLIGLRLRDEGEVLKISSMLSIQGSEFYFQAAINNLRFQGEIYEEISLNSKGTIILSESTVVAGEHLNLLVQSKNVFSLDLGKFTLDSGLLDIMKGEAKFNDVSLAFDSLSYHFKNNKLIFKQGFLSQLSPSPYFSNLKLVGEGQKNAEGGWKFHLQFKGFGSRQPPSLEINLTGSKGNFIFNFPQFNLSQWKEVSKKILPKMSEQLSPNQGVLSFIMEGPLNARLGPIALRGKLQNASLIFEGVEINKFNLHFDFADLVKMKSRRPAFFNAQEIVWGHKVQKVRSSFELMSKNKWLIHDLSAQTEFGEFETKKIDLNLASKSSSLASFNIKRVNLEKILSLALKDAISATGELNGQVEVEVKNGSIILHRGKFTNAAEGKIQYDVLKQSTLAKMNNMGVDVLLNYLRNFHYRDITVDFRGDHTHHIYSSALLHGSNPVVFEGRPLKLKLNLDFNWMDMLKSTMGTSRISDNMEKKILQGAKK